MSYRNLSMTHRVNTDCRNPVQWHWAKWMLVTAWVKTGDYEKSRRCVKRSFNNCPAFAIHTLITSHVRRACHGMKQASHPHTLPTGICQNDLTSLAKTCETTICSGQIWAIFWIGKEASTKFQQNGWFALNIFSSAACSILVYAS